MLIAAGLDLFGILSSLYVAGDILLSIGYWLGVTLCIGAAFYMAIRLIEAMNGGSRGGGGGSHGGGGYGGGRGRR